MHLKDIWQIYEMCHNSLNSQVDKFPTWQQVVKAQQEGRLFAEDKFETGSLQIVGENECKITFKRETE